MDLKLLIIRDPSKKVEIDSALPADWRVYAVGDKFDKGNGPFKIVICACELYTPSDWQWYYAVLKYLVKDQSYKSLWTN